MTSSINSYRFTSSSTARVIKSWIKLEEPKAIPWTPLAKPLKESTVALISSGALALTTQPPYDQEGERQNPFWGDPTYRVIPKGTKTEDIRGHHLHIDMAFVESDINCLLPLDRLDELEAAGVIGQAAENHYSYMGYNPQPEKLLTESVPGIIKGLQNDGVNLVVLIPA